MTANGHRPARTSGRLSDARTSLRHAIEATRRAFAEFLTIPTIVIGGFLLLALATYFLDQAHNAPRLAISTPASGGLFSDPEAARGFLGVVAASIITVTSITFSLLLIAVQQGAAALTNLVFDQFLRRRANQLFFGFFIGLGLYSLAMLATINPSHQPIYGVLFAGLMTVLALYMLVLLIYTTIDQMRPVVIIKAIHNRTLLARECQLHFLRHSRRSSRVEGGVAIPVTADQNGFLAQLNIAAIEKAVAQIGCEAEVVVLISFGDYVAFGDPIAEIRADFATDISPLVPVVKAAISLEEQRDLDTDPGFGIEQLLTIGWTSISTAKSNPHPGLLACWSLRDLLARWLGTEDRFGTGLDIAAARTTPVVYVDAVPEQLLKAFESLAVVASESMQHQCVAEIYRTFATAFRDLPAPLRKQAEDFLLRSLSALGEHVLTSTLDAAVSTLADALADAGRSHCADTIRAARRQLGMSIGRLNSRSTRADIQDEPSIAC